MRWNLRSFDGRTRIPELVGEVAQFSGDRSPTSTHARLRDTRLVAARGLFVDDQSERHVLREQLLKFPQLGLTGILHPIGQRQPDTAVDARHAKGSIFD